MVKPPFIEITCPVCSKPVKTLERYPRSLCSQCSARVTDRSGRLVVFYDIQALPAPNSSGVTLIGGFYGYYANTGLQEIYPSSTCYVDGITCEAKNARFGGIVIEALTAQPSRRTMSGNLCSVSQVYSRSSNGEASGKPSQTPI